MTIIGDETMRKCPFCGAPKDDFGGMVPEAFARCVETGTFAMGCSRCNTTGPMMPSMEEAITAWNTRSPDAVTVKALESLCRKYAAAWAAISFAHDEGFEWPVDPLGEEAIAFADPTVVPEYAVVAALLKVTR